MTRRTLVTPILAVCLGFSASACVAANHSHVEDHWGESYRSLMAQQVANPDAGKETKSVEGMNSTTAADVTETYHYRQSEQPRTTETQTQLDDVTQ
ncbi:MAG TPA: hypothetical protein VNE71_16425 [Myxococcota bacterium]|nr:hypothetical protein [Myxococcota bacterium]